MGGHPGKWSREVEGGALNTSHASTGISCNLGKDHTVHINSLHEDGSPLFHWRFTFTGYKSFSGTNASKNTVTENGPVQDDPLTYGRRRDTHIHRRGKLGIGHTEIPKGHTDLFES